MLFKHIFSLCALALGSLAAPSAPLNSTLMATRAIDDSIGPEIVGGYTTQEKAQIQQAHLDAVKLCWTMVNHTKSAQFDRIFPKYFNIDDWDLVIYVLNKIVGESATDGNNILEQIRVVPNLPNGCNDGETYASLRDASKIYPSLIVCPRAFKHGSFDGPVWPGVADVNCDSIDPRVSWRMMTLGHIFVHQYTFFQQLEGEILKALGGTTFDLADGPIKVLDIDRYKARLNADSYAWFVTEFAWTSQCGADFEAPIAGDDRDPF